MAVSVKTYLNFDKRDPEIRRFSVPQDASSSYLYLVEKIQRVYPTLLRQDFQLFWQDDDGELITFSSDEELFEALQSLKSDFLKVFIRVKQEANTEQNSGEGSAPENHVGVVCDVCDSEIKGTRFKCMVCPNYDLCGQCENKGFHPEHEMIRIRKPRTNVRWGPGRMRGRRFHGKGHHCGKGQRHPCGGGFSFQSGFGPGRGHCPFFQQNFGGPDRQPSNQPGPSEGEQSAKWAQVNVPEYFKAFGEYLGTVLHPFGVDVETYVDPPQACSENEDGNNCQTNPATDEASTTVGSETTTENQDPPDEVFASSNTAEVTSEEPLASPVQDPDFVMVDSSKDDNRETNSEHPQQTTSEETDAPAVAVDPFQRRLDEAIAQMEAMGFKNDDGWLTQLLVAKDCDVGRVINTILPQGRFT